MCNEISDRLCGYPTLTASVWSSTSHVYSRVYQEMTKLGVAYSPKCPVSIAKLSVRSREVIEGIDEAPWSFQLKVGSRTMVGHGGVQDRQDRRFPATYLSLLLRSAQNLNNS